MPFQLEHDWQQSLSTPRARVGEATKTHLLLLLCVVWILVGLLGHQPWKPDESASISIVKSMVQGNDVLLPHAASESTMLNPPLYYWTAANFSKLFGGVLPFHDAARLATGFWMALTLLMVGMTGRELWGKGSGRHTNFIFMGSLGLILPAHYLYPYPAGLAGVAIGFYAMALTRRRPYRAGVLLGLGLAISFLGLGVINTALLLLPMALLPLLFAPWRTRSVATSWLLALAIFSVLAGAWVLAASHADSHTFNIWWQESLNNFNHTNFEYFAVTASWFAWPALPLALWGLWRFRLQLFKQPKFQLIVLSLISYFVLISIGATDKETYLLPFLVPLAALAGGSVDSLRRGAASALNWFGLMLFSLIGFLVWLGWFAMMTGWPEKLYERMRFLSSISTPHFHIWLFLPALFITLIWLAMVRAKQSNRAAITDWTVGITMAWGLLMTLWLPWIDSARSYQNLWLKMRQSMPAQYACMSGRNLKAPQVDLLHYYLDIKVQAYGSSPLQSCDLYLIMDNPRQPKVEVGSEWKLIWQGSRPRDKDEKFRLYQYQQH